MKPTRREETGEGGNSVCQLLCYMGNVYSWDTAPIPESRSFQEQQPNAHSHFTGLRFICDQHPRTKIKS